MSHSNVISSDEWKERIAARAKTAVEDVGTILDQHEIRPQSVFPRARKLRVGAIRFSGVKHGQSDRFEFSWNGLDTGIWGILSGGNSKGKSSIVNILRGALQGRFPGHLKPDVWKWLDHIEVTFLIDGVSYCVEVDKEAGVEDEGAATARLSRRQEVSTLLYEGRAGVEFQAAVSDLFMDELGFERIHAFHKANDLVVQHGWPAMSAALFVKGDGPALFGDNTVDGLPIRLIQWFIGLPWISTYTAAAAAEKRLVEANKRKTASTSAARANARSRLDTLEEQLRTLRAENQTQPNRPDLRRRLLEMDRSLANVHSEVSVARRLLDDASLALSQAKDASIEARRSMQQARDEAAAGYVFRRLKPKCCPSCEASIDVGRFKAVSAETCGLCGNVEVPPAKDDGDDLSALELAANDAAQQLAVRAKDHEEVKNRYDQTKMALTNLLKAAEDLQTELSQPDRSVDLAREIAVIEALIKELSGETENLSGDVASENVLTVLKSATAVSKALMEETQADILRQVSEALMTYSTRLGVQNLDDMKLSAHRLDIKQGGAENMTFGSLSPGENLRVRVAAALAVLDVARRSGVGRHPGLLVLDSPGAQEMAAEFAALIGSIGEAVKDQPELQVFIGAVNRPEFQMVVPVDRRKQAFNEDKLF